MMRSRWIPFAAMFVLVIAGALSLWSPASPGQAPDKPAVVTWGYKTVIGTSTQPNDDELNRLGKDGWELFMMQQEGNSQVRFVFRRPNPK
jgi:hypothetical protein